MKLLRLGISTLAAALITTSCTFANTAKMIHVVDQLTGDSIYFPVSHIIYTKTGYIKAIKQKALAHQSEVALYNSALTTSLTYKKGKNVNETQVPHYQKGKLLSLAINGKNESGNLYFTYKLC